MGRSNLSDTTASTDIVEDGIASLYDTDVLERIEGSVQLLLGTICSGSTDREGLRDTPKRVARAWIEATSGYREDIDSVLGGALFHEALEGQGGQGMILVRDVGFASTSEDSLLPFHGKCHLTYVPRNGVVLGLSKVARLAAMYARRLQSQPRFTAQLLQGFEAAVRPHGCAILVEAHHLADTLNMAPRVTSAASGCFLDSGSVLLQDFANLMGLPVSAMPASSAFEVDSLAAECQRAPSMSCSCGAGREGQPNTSPAMVAQLAEVVDGILRDLGEDPARQGLRGSSRRYAEYLLEATSGYGWQPGLLPAAVRPDASVTQNGAAIAPDVLHVKFASQCEHHLLPFWGMLHIACLPGASGAHLTQQMLQEVVAGCSRRLQIQERLTAEVARMLEAIMGAEGLVVVCQAAHMCMVARGVQQLASTTVTLSARGSLEQPSLMRSQLLGRLMTVTV